MAYISKRIGSLKINLALRSAKIGAQLFLGKWFFWLGRRSSRLQIGSDEMKQSVRSGAIPGSGADLSLFDIGYRNKHFFPRSPFNPKNDLK
jgi:hypothetical protein